MVRQLWDRTSTAVGRDGVDALVFRIARLVRHRGFDRTQIISALLLKYVPNDTAYDWSGEATLRARLVKADLDETTLRHLIASARLEIAMIEERLGF